MAITDYLYFYLQGDLSERSVIFLRCLYRVFLLFIAIAATIPKNTSSKRNYFIINPTFGEKLLGIFPYLAVAVLIGFTLKEQTSSATLITGNCIAFVFVLIRHTIVRMQNKELTKTLKVFNNQLEQTVSQRTRDLINKSNDLVKIKRDLSHYMSIIRILF